MKFTPKKLVVLCATQRCGSTMVVEDMRSTGVLGVPEEYFIPWDASKKDLDWCTQLNSLFKRASTDNGVVSVKIMANQLQSIEDCLKHSSGSSNIPIDEKGLFPHFKAHFKSAKFVFIRRDSIVRQAVSRGMSRQTGINHATANANDDHFAGNLLKGYKDNYNSAVSYDQAILESDISTIAKENLLWESFFASWNIANPLSLRYEEICKNSPHYLKRIANYSGIELDENSLPANRTMIKMSNKKNEEWCDSFLSTLIDSGK